MFSTLGNDYFEILFNKKIILSDQKNGGKYRDIVPLKKSVIQVCTLVEKLFCSSHMPNRVKRMIEGAKN